MDMFVGTRPLIDIDIEETLIKKVGGKFALTSLLQKRMVELNRGAPPLVKVEQKGERSLRAVAYQEILEEKIVLAQYEEVEYAKTEETPQIESPEVVAPPAEEGSEIYGSDIKRIKEQRIKELAQLLNPKK